MTYRRIMRIAIIIMSIALAFMIYYSYYNINPSQADIEKHIEEFIEKDITVIGFKEVDNKLAVYFVLESNDSIGFTALYKGINFRYQIRNVSYFTRSSVIKGASFETNHGKYLAILGVNYDGKIARFSIQTTSGNKFSENIDGESQIFKIIETHDRTYLSKWKLYDKDGNDITEHMKKYTTTKENGNVSIFGGESFFIYVYCFMVIIMGYFISWIIKNQD